MSEEKLHQEDERLDELFRRSLGEMRSEPSAGVWKKVNRTLFRSELSRFHFGNLPKATWGIIPAAVIITGIALYFGLTDTTVTSGQAHKRTVEARHASPKQTVTGGPADQRTSGQVDHGKPIAGTTAPTHQDSISPYHQNTIPPSTPPYHHTTTPPSPDTTVTSGPADQRTVEARHASPKQTVTSGQADKRTSGQVDSGKLAAVTTVLTPQDTAPPYHHTTIPPSTDTTAPLPHGITRAHASSLDIGLNITPDMVFYQEGSGSFKYNYSFDLGARYNIGRFYIQSGVGLMYSQDIGNYAISYLSNDSVGFYYVVDQYTIDPGNPGVPLFETKQVTVYDSVQHLTDNSTKNTYYYIQLPLTAGFRIINKPLWRLSVEAGLFYTWLVSSDEPAPSYYISEGRVLEIERESPERNSQSLGLTGGISVEYQFARNFFLLVEPTMKYYVQAIQENSSRGDKQPFSIGLRAGIWYRMNFKNKTK